MCRTSSVGRMLAHFPDELRNGVPFSFASRIVELVKVAPGLGRIRSRLSTKKMRSVSMLTCVEERGRGQGRAFWRLTAIVLEVAMTTGAGKKGGTATTKGVRRLQLSIKVDCAHWTESLKKEEKQVKAKER